MFEKVLIFLKDIFFQTSQPSREGSIKLLNLWGYVLISDYQEWLVLAIGYHPISIIETFCQEIFLYDGFIRNGTPSHPQKVYHISGCQEWLFLAIGCHLADTA